MKQFIKLTSRILNKRLILLFSSTFHNIKSQKWRTYNDIYETQPKTYPNQGLLH